jgi:hypothetical protein
LFVVRCSLLAASSSWLLGTGFLLLASGYWLFLNVARIGLANRQLLEASSQ